jgi:hypothetical protein
LTEVMAEEMEDAIHQTGPLLDIMEFRSLWVITAE